MRFFFGFLFLLVGVRTDAQVKRSLTPMDVASLKSVAAAAWSDDGNIIAYTQRVQSDPTIENKPSRTELYLYNVANGSSTPFVTRGNVRMINFRPGQNTITYLNKLENDKVSSLYQISLNGGEASLLYKFETSISYYQWSPDGKTLAFVANKPEEKAKAALPYSPELYEQNLAIARIYLVEPGIGTAKEILVDGHFTEFEWSPDGKKLLCAKAPTSLVDDSYMAMSLSVVDIATMKVLSTIDHQGKLGEFKWSPDGNQIAFIAGSDLHDPTDGSLFIVPATGGKPTILVKDWEGMFEQIIWQDPGQIHFMGSTGVESVYGIIKADAKAKPVFQSIEKGFNITHFELSANGRGLFVADRYNHPTELFIEGTGQSEMKRITDSNPMLADIEFAKQEVVKYKAKDGLEIEGLLIRTLHEEGGKKYPLITIVHGGPEAHFNNGWLTAYSNPGQTGAAEGYAVFYPNYRGSTGRGVKFTLTSQGDPAGKEFDDVVDGVDYLIASGLVDATKVGVTGGSYGGYATGWFSTRYTDRFAAGVMFVGISDNVSKWGTTDIPNEEYLVHSRKWVYDDYDFFLKRSPIYYAGQCKTPLLIMHGKDDPRVHPSQSMELYRHVKSRTTTPVELVFYPGEGHGNANSTARYDYNLRLMSWFDKYLKGVDKGKS
ncbi:MAG TPA: S9 family peptidase [Saprospiraceae bacterium]